MITAQHDGREVFMSVRTAGWMLCVPLAIRGRSHTATGTTLTDCEVYALDIDDFRWLRTQVPEFGDWIQQMLAADAIGQFAGAASLVPSDCESRLRWLFVELFRARGQRENDGSYRLRLSVSVTQVADLVIASRPWTSRTLSRWAEDGVLCRRKGWFVIPSGSPLIAHVLSSLEIHALPALPHTVDFRRRPLT